MNEITLFFPIIKDEFYVVTADGAYTLKIGPVPSGKTWLVTQWSILNNTTRYTTLRVGVESGGKVHYIEELAPTAINVVEHNGCLAPVPETCFFVFACTGLVTGDILTASIFGGEYFLPGGPGPQRVEP